LCVNFMKFGFVNGFDGRWNQFKVVPLDSRLRF